VFKDLNDTYPGCIELIDVKNKFGDFIIRPG
jgi:hypothetical protein